MEPGPKMGVIGKACIVGLTMNHLVDGTKHITIETQHSQGGKGSAHGGPAG